jgi:hypothetical protein
MFANTQFVGNNYKWFIGQVPPSKNQYQKDDIKWSDAWGDRVKVRIPGIHPQDNTIKDDDLPWAIIAKPTSQGNFNGGSTGIMGGEWVIGFFMDESNQIPIITHVLGVNIVGNAADAQKLKQLGSTFFQHIRRYDGTGLAPGNSEVSGGSTKSSGTVGPSISKDTFSSAVK